MKKHVLSFTLLFSAALLCACGAGTVSAAPPSPVAETASPSVVSSPEEEVWEADPVEGIVRNDAMGAVSLIDGCDTTGEYTDGVGNTCLYTYRLPIVLGDTDYVKAVNAELEDVIFSQYVTPAFRAMEDGVSLDVSHVSWTAGSYQGYTSLLVTVNSNYDLTRYFCYAFAPDGTAATNDTLLALTGFTPEQFTVAASAKLSDWMQGFPEEYRSRTLASENLNASLPLFVSDQGTLSFVCKGYSPAGAEYYYHLYTLVPEGGFCTAELETLALENYETSTGYRPQYVGSLPNEEGTLDIQLYDVVIDHTATADWYTVDPLTGLGSNLLGWPIDLTVR